MNFYENFDHISGKCCNFPALVLSWVMIIQLNTKDCGSRRFSLATQFVCLIISKPFGIIRLRMILQSITIQLEILGESEYLKSHLLSFFPQNFVKKIIQYERSDYITLTMHATGEYRRHVQHLWYDQAKSV